jgi:hypothetical protein
MRKSYAWMTRATSICGGSAAFVTDKDQVDRSARADREWPSQGHRIEAVAAILHRARGATASGYRLASGTGTT